MEINSRINNLIHYLQKGYTFFAYLIIFNNTLFSQEIDSLSFKKNEKMLLTPGFNSTYSLGNIKVCKVVNNIDSIPVNIRDNLEIKLRSKLGDNYNERVNFYMCKIVEDTQNVEKNIKTRPKIFYEVWLKFNILITTKIPYLAILIFTSEGQLIRDILDYPNVIKDPSKNKVLTFQEIYNSVIIKNLKFKKRKVYILRLGIFYHPKEDFLYWRVAYGQRCFWCIGSNRFLLKINAHTGTVLSKELF